jgi:hypothetical protein
MTNISSTSRKEETRSQASLFIVFAGDREGDSHPVQPEDTPFVASISPFGYLFEDVDAGVREATRVVPLVVSIEGGLCNRRK